MPRNLNTQGMVLLEQYSYGPFGEVLRATGPMAKVNPFRFSTQYQDDETDLLMYVHRPYSASQGRFLCKDPLGDEAFFRTHFANSSESKVKRLEEEALLPAYLFVHNDPIARCDVLGLYNNCCCDAEGIALSKKALIGRYNTAQNYLDPYRPKSMPEEGSWSCLNVALDISKFMAPIPRCWTCYVEERWGKWRPFGAHDLNAIVCVAHPKSGTPEKIYFDYWHHAPPAQPYSGFLKDYPKPGQVMANLPEFDCSGPWLDWPASKSFGYLQDITGGR